MKIILTHEVANLGVAGDIVEVKDGYARNYLIPRSVAIRWTKGGQKDVDAIRRARRVREIQTLEQAQAVKGELEALTVRLETRAGNTGRLFGAITPADIAGAIKSAGGPDVDKRRIQVSAPIKALGQHKVAVKLHPEVEANLGVTVVGA
ncbi:50S ribosomal protein L9 [Mangrovactinospora gilvigrisea]|uniref:Large ribosomal subunit protein bL9 n=1 Tax=Mangrovactinospora gilvigrisea TaxID=1428644 RepID=A0A1J7BVL2_9ACTN|nr:50S ribosomal protein L9 [Mangrovactinospora gilvigrisea]OIV37513.1 50S ribosomal protein L9 [Mangrovactinospora gilvigrisea]